MSTKITFNGFDRLRKNLDSISGENEISFTELFPDGFITQNTNFQTLQQMVDASGIENPEDINGEVWDKFVAENSRFGGWEDMHSTAINEWIGRKLTA